jgi:ABC-type transport system substrate-binding protein
MPPSAAVAGALFLARDRTRREKWMKHRRIGLALVIPALVATACGSGGSSPSGSSGAALAPNQQFRFPIVDDIKTLDPGHVSDAVSIEPVRNMFDGLYKFDDKLKEVPDIATALPDISSDGMTYTFHMRQNVKFSNGDPVTSADVLYSWNRAARLNDSRSLRPRVPPPRPPSPA